VQCSLGISVPAATQLRQAAALHALRAAFPDADWLADLMSVSERIVDVKSALRQALAPQLGRALGWQVSVTIAPMIFGTENGTVLMNAHPK
jgi:hypothetical protein